MKYLIRAFLFNVFSLWLVSATLPALVIVGNWQSVLLAGLVLSLLMILVAPVLKILFIPINFLTFGLLSWFINVIVLYLLTVFVPQVEVRAWRFPGFSWQGFIVPAVNLNYTASLIICAIAITMITNLLHSLSED